MPKEGSRQFFNFSDASIPEEKHTFLFLALNAKPSSLGYVICI
jgi:hypothetical protein